MTSPSNMTLSETGAIEPTDKVEILTLHNGLTCWLRPHRHPAKQISLCLQLGVGSLVEDASQWGICHFLEHMAFRGTEHFPDTEWMNFLESLGHRFGTHQNAFTGLDQTNYFFSLADHRPHLLDKAFLGLADIAFRLALHPDAVAKERKVILEEYRNQQNLKVFLQKKKLEALFPHSKIAHRDPLGIPETIATFDVEMLRNFHKNFYRPDQALLMVVGDFELSYCIERIQHHFGFWQKPSLPKHTMISGIQPSGDPRFHQLIDPSGQVARVEIAQFGPYFPLTTRTNFHKNLLRDLAFLILDRRLQNATQKGDIPVFEAKVHSSAILNFGVIAKVAALGKTQNLFKVIEALFREIARVHRFGFLPEEVTLIGKMLLQGAEDQIEQEDSRTSRQLIWHMKANGRDRTLPLDPETRLDYLKYFLTVSHAENITDAFKTYLGIPCEKLLVILPSAGVLNPETVAGIKALGFGKKISHILPPAKLPQRLHLEAVGGRPGSILESWDIEDLGISGLRLDNGIRLQCRPMTFQPQKFYLKLVLPMGRNLEEASQFGITDAAVQGLFQPAAKDVLPGQFQTLLLEKNLKLGGSCGEDEITIDISGHSNRLPFALLFLQGLLTKPYLDAQVFQKWRDQSILRIQRRQSNIRLQIDHQFWKLVTRDDPRFRDLEIQHIKALSLDDCRQWLTYLCHKAPFELAIVGDVDRITCFQWVQKYLGPLAFESQEPPKNVTRRLPRVIGPKCHTATIPTQDAHCAVRLGWRSVAWQDVPGRRHLNMAELIFTKRLRSSIREQEGLTYHIQCQSKLSKSFPTGSFLVVNFQTAPNQGNMVADMAKTLLENCIRTGFTVEEMEEARQLTLQRMEDVIKHPQYWQQWLADFHYRDTRFDTLRSTKHFFQTCRQEDILQTLRQVMVQGHYFQMIVQPEK